MQQGRGGMGIRKYGVSGRPSQSPRLRLAIKLAAEREEYDKGPRRNRGCLEFATVRATLSTRQRGH